MILPTLNYRKALSLLTVTTSILIVGCSDSKSTETEAAMAQINYPTTATVDTVDTYHGTQVADPYRWLEDDRSEETGAWVDAQNEVTQDYLEQIPFRESIKEKLTKLWDYEKIGSPFKEGNKYYQYKNSGIQNQYVVYQSDSETGEQRVFLDPNTFSDDGTVSLAGLSFSKDGSRAAYQISEGGSDWRKVLVMDTETREVTEDTLVDIKFSGLSWRGNDGFYYSSYDKPKGSELSAKTDTHKVYYHKLGTPQSSDRVVYGDKADQKGRYNGAYVTEDGRYLVISRSISTSGNELRIVDLSKDENTIIDIITGYDTDTSVLHTDGDKLWLTTNKDAPNKRVVTTTIQNPAPSTWVDFIPETKNVLSVGTGGGNFFANYMVDAVTAVKQYDITGKLIRDIELPGVGSAGGFGADWEDDTLYYSFSNYITPGSIYKYYIDSGNSELFNQPKIAFDSQQFDSKQVFYTSKDGVEVPMIISYKKGTPMDGTAPTILYGYGGFNVSLTPSFSVTNAAWMDMGGIYAVANLRGGGEYGKEWHDAGTKMQKQNVFDDFIAAGEYLIENNYTSSEKLAVRGGSNGGLLVGAVTNQRPDLMAVALPAVGVMDMLRYHTFTAGAGWAYDYGTSEDSPEMFEYLKAYSPVHNVEEGAQYPAIMVTTADHDDRVVPAHSFKYIAELQAKNASDNPVLIRIEKDAGHGAGTPVSKTIEQYADIYGFTLYNMGYDKLPGEVMKK